MFTYLDERYDVIYQSKQSYYDLLSAANISWNSSQKINPRSDPELVKKKRSWDRWFLEAAPNWNWDWAERSSFL